MRKHHSHLFIALSIIIVSCTSSRLARQSAKIVAAPTTLKVMTYNVHHCNPPSESNTGKIDIEAIVHVIRKQNPDVVALQELDDHTTRSGSLNQLEVIAKKLNMYFYFGKAMDFGGGGYGVGILSKYPLSETTTHQLPVTQGWKGEPRVLATARISLPGGSKIVFGSTHLEAYSKENRVLQVEEIAEIAAQEMAPLIIAGDFNATPESNTIRVLDSMFTRSCISGCPPTFDEEDEHGTIDYIAFMPMNHFEVIQHQVIEEKYASDHFPVVAVLKIKYPREK